METFTTFQEAEKEAKNFFKRNFGYTTGVGIESAKGDQIEFYSLDDPGMDDTFVCIIDDGRGYYCKNGGRVRIYDNKPGELDA